MRHLRTLIIFAIAGAGFYLLDIPGLIGGGIAAILGLQMAPRDSFLWASSGGDGDSGGDDGGSGSSDGGTSGSDGGGGGDGGGD